MVNDTSNSTGTVEDLMKFNATNLNAVLRPAGGHATNCLTGAILYNDVLRLLPRNVHSVITSLGAARCKTALVDNDLRLSRFLMDSKSCERLQS
jgi:hypothetical protein